MCKWFVITIMKSFLLLVDILTPNHLNSGVHLLYVIVFSSLRLGFFFWGSYYVSVRSFTAHFSGHNQSCVETLQEALLHNNMNTS